MPDDRQDASRAARSSSRLLTRFWGSLTSGRRRSTKPSSDMVTGLAHGLLSDLGDVSGVRLATDLKAAYEALDPSARARFLDRLVHEFGPDGQALESAIADHRAHPSPTSRHRLHSASEPARQEMLRRFNAAPGGTAALIDIRREVLLGLEAHPEWSVLDGDLLHLLRSWFNPGFLTLRRIDWRTPAVTLERIVEYEAVHAIQGWRDLRRRLEADRRCYGFFHQALPDEPLIFIEVALTRELPGQVQPLLDPAAPVRDPKQATHAIFYSITNCQAGLRGVSFGNFLIKQVVDDLRLELPRIRTFATLSPIPGFRGWLSHAATRAPGQTSALSDAFAGLLDADGTAATTLLTEKSRAQLMSLCARYLVHEKRAERALDPVARFHLANGARLERLNWKGDPSEDGLRQSFGITANYQYRIAQLETNHEVYVAEGRVMTSASVARLARLKPKRW